MTTTSTHPSADRGAHDVRNAWLSVLLLPIAFGLAFLIGEGLIGLFGYPVGDTAGEAPLWAILAATIPALLVSAYRPSSPPGSPVGPPHTATAAGEYRRPCWPSSRWPSSR
ncbi:hypothetical protein [Janibacter sp. DB-40]|uniref:hypothetical protein n=1 Tax=Janibacter sp. DB-40 TaxID=3028808 RepID=UPI002404B6F1|nr:hypothetical protein [Janibacter sp. DB-40]